MVKVMASVSTRARVLLRYAHFIYANIHPNTKKQNAPTQTYTHIYIQANKGVKYFIIRNTNLIIALTNVKALSLGHGLPGAWGLVYFFVNDHATTGARATFRSETEI